MNGCLARLIILALLLLGGIQTHAQTEHKLMVSGGFDLIKSDNIKVFEKAQVGLEGNYFLKQQLAVGAGIEIWIKQNSSFVVGARWYADEHLFFRLRGLVGVNNDASADIGWSRPLSEQWRFEGIGDFYFNQKDFALRAGVSYVIR